MSQRNYKKYLRIATGVLALSMVLSNYAMALDMFLKVDGIRGESVDAQHKDEIDILAWSWGASQSGNTQSGGGGGAGTSHVQDISVTKYVDKSSPLLLGKICTGEHIREINLTVRKSGAIPLEFYRVKLSDCLVSSVSTGGSGGGERMTENVSINFAKFNLVYTSQRPDGTSAGEISFGYDIKAQRQVQADPFERFAAGKGVLADSDTPLTSTLLAWSGIK
jgi:type VI secretion system secreted protein Hcp